MDGEAQGELAGIDSVHKISQQIDGEWVAVSRPRSFDVENRGNGVQRLIACGGLQTFERLAASLEAPCFLLYILHTPRGEAVAGRYQSSQLDHAELTDFLDRFGPYLAGDARHDIWLHSPADKATVVWDRHDLIYVYGPHAQFSDVLEKLGYETGMAPDADFLHMHHYREEFDPIAAEIVSTFSWTYSPLRPEDEQ
tara:strand:+ start:5124 stop:5711 length:588 start_codon:yes stop_codon:yes gene_type:complete